MSEPEYFYGIAHEEKRTNIEQDAPSSGDWKKQNSGGSTWGTAI